MDITKLRRVLCRSFIFLVLFTSSSSTDAYDALDPNGNITIKWDIMQWTTDGYVAVVNMYNYQQYRHIQAPGWQLGWSWAKNEIIWSIIGAKSTKQGNCSRFKRNIPQNCEKDPRIIDLRPGAPYNMQVENCCKGGVLSSFAQNPSRAVSSFQIVVGVSGSSNSTVHLPRNVSIKAPGPGYTCGAAKVVKSTRFITPDGRRVTQALMTWNVTCTYSQFLVRKTPACCVSLSSTFDNDTATVDCPKCACACPSNKTSCVKTDGKGSLVQCTSHKCPIKVSWDYRVDYKKYWRVRITITNFKHGMNYTDWNLVVQHPNFDRLVKVYGLNYKALEVHYDRNDTAMLWGVKHNNDVIMEARHKGNMQYSELLFKKKVHQYQNNWRKWAFPRRVYFNGDDCMMPAPYSDEL